MAQKEKITAVKVNKWGVPLDRERGSGSLYKVPGCSTFQMRVYDDKGRARFKSSGTPDLRKALRALNDFANDARKGRLPSLAAERATVDKLMTLVFDSYRNRGKKSLDDIETRWRLHLQPFFSGYRTTRVTSAHIAEYVSQRLKQRPKPAKPATVNRELALLRSAYRLGAKQTPPLVQVQNIPSFELLAENNRRKNFLKGPEAFDRLAAECAKVGLWLRCLLQLGVDHGWRHAELLSLRTSAFNRLEQTVELDPGMTKNGEGRTVGLSARGYTYLMELCRGKNPDDKIFTRPNGKEVVDFRHVWQSACCAAGLGTLHCPTCKTEAVKKGSKWFCSECDRFVRRPTLKYSGLYVHDLRRTFATRCAKAGLDASAAMAVAGWKTNSLFERYNIKTVEQTRTVQVRLEAHEAEIEKRRGSLRSAVLPDALPPVQQPSELAN